MQDLVYINNKKIWNSDKRVKEVISIHKSDVAIILIHGFSATSDTYSKWINTLCKKNVSLFVPNLLGHNTYYTDLENYTIDEHKRQIENLYNSIKNNYKKIIIVGLSYGATVLIDLMFEKRFKKNTHFYLLAPSLDLIFSQKILLYIAYTLKIKKTKFIAGNTTNKSKILAYRNISIKSLLIFYKSISSVYKKVRHNPLEYNIKLFHSKKDQKSPIKTSKELYLLNKNNIELTILTQSKHELAIDYENKMILKKILDEI